MYQRKHKLSSFTHKLLGVAFLLATCVVPTMGQGNFQSGSTGADGAFSPTTNQTIVVPESGTFNFTTVSIPSGVTITFTPNSKNTPVTILANGDVTISGTISVAGKPGNTNGTGGLGGPGGFAGGNGGYGVADLFNGINGSGPGGGRGGISTGTVGVIAGAASFAGSGATGSSNVQPGERYGNGLLQPIIGGSGGGGGGARTNEVAGGGGGGGGAILIASSTSITLNNTGTIDARGGTAINNTSAPGGGGSGGAIRLIANSITGNGTLVVAGGNGGITSGVGVAGAGGFGYIRAEAFSTTGFTPTTSPTIVSISTPNPVVISNAPELRIVTVGGVTVPSTTIGSLVGAPDIVVPSTQTNPVAVALEGKNLPANTIATLTTTPATGTSTLSTSSLFSPTTTPNISSASAAVNLPAGISVISAVVIIDLTLAKLEPMFIDGEKVERIEITAVYGGESQRTYITSSGKKIVQ